MVTVVKAKILFKLGHRSIKSILQRAVRNSSSIEDGTKLVSLIESQVRQIGDSAFFDFAVLAIGLAEKDRWRRGAIGDNIDIHVYKNTLFDFYVNKKSIITWLQTV